LKKGWGGAGSGVRQTGGWIVEIENIGIAVSPDGASSAAIRGGAEDKLVYVGFWRRLAAHLIEIAILTPYALFSSWYAYAWKEGFLIGQLVGFIIAVLFEIYLVKRFGGSPGKLIMKIRIAKVDGSPVGYKEASIRYSVLFIISVLSSAGLLISALNMPAAEYAALTRKTRIQHLRELAPAWYQPVQIVGGIWVSSEFVVLLTNRKRRALHDFMAGTVVIRALNVGHMGTLALVSTLHSANVR
jgi:uncharacterized RDD family membrane protein YckC